ncbi:MAG: outer membrane lipoprotein-sorting protein [Maribacter sp.]|nr:outer membrane lipoprotein-sorting protein [Maribacter sp.]
MIIRKLLTLTSVFITIVSVFLLNGFSYANELNGTQIMDNVYKRDNGDGASANMSFNIIYPGGKEKVRDTKWIWIDLDGKGGMDEKFMFFFLSPPDIKDTAFLSWNYEKYDKDDDQWVYLPALRKTRRIASSSKHDSFFGTEFNYSDLNTRDLNEDKHKFLRTETLQTIECYIVESNPKDKKDAYSKILAWVDPERWVILKAEFYNRKGEHSKTELIEWELIQNKWTAKKMTMENHLNGNKTVVTLKGFKYSNGFKEKLFHERTLKRGVR